MDSPLLKTWQSMIAEGSKMTKQQKIERYFKALGWEQTEYPTCDPEVPLRGLWKNDKVTMQFKDLPDIIDHFPSFKKWVLEVMEGEGYKPYIPVMSYHWIWINGHSVHEQEVTDNNITEAAVEAATEYLEGENAKGS